MRWSSLTRVLLPAASFALLLGAAVAVVAAEFDGRQTPSTGEVALRQIDVWADFAKAEGLSPELVEELRRLPEVESVEGVLRSSVYAAGSTPGTFNMTAITYRAMNPPPDIVWADNVPVADRFSIGDILVPAQTQGTDFKSMLGQTIDIGYTRMIAPGEGVGEVTTARVIGVYDPSFEADGFATVYASTETIESYRSDSSAGGEAYLPGFEMATVTVADQQDVPVVASVLRSMELDVTVIEERTGDLSSRISALEVTGFLAALGLLIGEIVLVAQGAKMLIGSRIKDFALRLASGAGVGPVVKRASRELLVPFAVVGALGVGIGSAIVWLSWPSSGSGWSVATVFLLTTLLLFGAVALAATTASRRLVTADLIGTLNGE